VCLSTRAQSAVGLTTASYNLHRTQLLYCSVRAHIFIIVTYFLHFFTYFLHFLSPLFFLRTELENCGAPPRLKKRITTQSSNNETIRASSFIISVASSKITVKQYRWCQWFSIQSLCGRQSYTRPRITRNLYRK
jgi:hypothetical protein